MAFLPVVFSYGTLAFIAISLQLFFVHFFVENTRPLCYNPPELKAARAHSCGHRVTSDKGEGKSMTYQHKNRGVCSISTTVTLDDEGVIQELQVLGGCNGNLKGIMSLVKGMKAEDAIARLEGITCGSRPTSCPDQISKALREALEQH